MNAAHSMTEGWDRMKVPGGWLYWRPAHPGDAVFVPDSGSPPVTDARPLEEAVQAARAQGAVAMVAAFLDDKGLLHTAWNGEAVITLGLIEILRENLTRAYRDREAGRTERAPAGEM